MRKFDGRLKSLEKTVKAMHPDEYPFVSIGTKNGESIIVNHYYARTGKQTIEDEIKTKKALTEHFKDKVIKMLFFDDIFDVEIVPGSLADEVFNKDLWKHIEFDRGVEREYI